MSVQLVLLKSGEEIIADVREIVDKETGKQMSLVLIKPVRVTIAKHGLLTEDNSQPQNILNFEPWIATSKNEEFFIDQSWVVTVAQPQDEITNSYIENVGVKDDSESFTNQINESISDSGD